MQYKCKSCRRRFDFEDFIEFCPYCGKMFDMNPDLPQTLTDSSELAQVIDSIWGNKARLTSELSEIISRCVFLINAYSEKALEMALSQQDLSKYEKNYTAIKQSNNRKNLIARLDSFIESLDAVIDNLSDCIFADITSSLESVFCNTDEMAKELYDFVGIRYISPATDFFSEENYSVTILYTKEQLRDLYNLVIVAYSKYKRCVEDNNMFAAFSSSSDYGTLPNYWCRLLNRLYSYDDDDYNDDEQENPQFDEVVEYMKECNLQKYSGMLDENFVPHVDAFWYGLQMLCGFIDNRIAVEFKKDRFFISSKESSKLQSVVLSKEFEINNNYLEGAIELKDHFENRLKKLNSKKE